MPRPRKPARLWMRPSTGEWIILDGGKQVRTGAAIEEKALIALGIYLRQRSGRKTPVPETVAAALRAALASAKSRAKSRGWSFNLTDDHLRALYERGGGCCGVTGIPFRIDHIGTTRRNPYSPSLDRIDGTKGYAVGNVRLVLVAVNLAINEFGEGLLREIAEAMVFKTRRSEAIDLADIDGFVASATKPPAQWSVKCLECHAEAMLIPSL